MRRSSSLSLFALVPCVLLPLACVQPEWPDEFEETVHPSTAAEASAVLPGFEAGGPALVVDAGVPPGVVLPEAGLPPSGGNQGGIQGGGGFDAGSVAPPTRDAGSQPQLDATTQTDARASEDAGDPGPTTVGPTRCTITASTDASNTFLYAGKYGCAVWIGDASKKVVKAFFLATRIASRSGLSTYRTASSGVSVDVVAGATLSSPKQHMYTWDLKSAAGAAAAAGSYTLNVETHSSNGDKTVSVPFELGTGPVMATATPAGEVRAASIQCE